MLLQRVFLANKTTGGIPCAETPYDTSYAKMSFTDKVGQRLDMNAAPPEKERGT